MRCFASGWKWSLTSLAVAASLSAGGSAGTATAEEQSSVLVPSVLVDNAVTAPVSQVAELAPSAAAAEKVGRDVTPRSIPLTPAAHEPATQDQIDATGEKVRRV